MSSILFHLMVAEEYTSRRLSGESYPVWADETVRYDSRNQPIAGQSPPKFGHWWQMGGHRVLLIRCQK